MNIILQRLGLRAPRRFVLLCHQRSGSNMIMSSVRQHPAIAYYGQLYKDDPAHRRRVDALAGIPYTGQAFDDTIAQRQHFERLSRTPAARDPARNAAAFTKAFFHQAGRRGRQAYTGIKLHGGTLYPDEIGQLFLDGKTKVIIQHRENLLAAAISWYQARELGQWRRDGGEAVQTTALHMDLDRLRWFIDNTRRDVALWKQLCAEAGVSPLELTYEKIVADIPAATRAYWAFLGLSPLAEAAPKTKKLIKSYAHIQNIDAIRRELGGAENGEV